MRFRGFTFPSPPFPGASALPKVPTAAAQLLRNRHSGNSDPTFHPCLTAKKKGCLNPQLLENFSPKEPKAASPASREDVKFGIGIFLGSTDGHSVVPPKRTRGLSPGEDSPLSQGNQESSSSSGSTWEQGGPGHSPSSSVPVSQKTAFFFPSHLSLTSSWRFMALANRHPVQFSPSPCIN